MMIPAENGDLAEATGGFDAITEIRREWEAMQAESPPSP